MKCRSRALYLLRLVSMLLNFKVFKDLERMYILRTFSNKYTIFIDENSKGNVR